MPYIDKNGKPILWEEVNYANQYKKALIYYPVKAKRISGTPVPSPSPTSSPTPTPTSSVTPTPTPTPSPTPAPVGDYIITQDGFIFEAQNGDLIEWFEPPFDSDAQLYIDDVITSGGTIDATMSAATNTLFTSLKSAGLYSKIYTMYPFLGGTAASHAINAKLNKSFDITWNGGMTHDISGSTGNGTNAYGDTGFNFQVEIGSAVGISSHSSIYVGTETATPTNSEFGYRFGSGNDNWIMAVSFGDVYYGWQFGQGAFYAVDFSNPDARGNYIQSRTSTTSLEVYKNGSLQDTNTRTSINSAPNANLRLFNDNVEYSDRRLQFTTIGDGLSASEITTLDGIINTFQTTLGRNTY